MGVQVAAYLDQLVLLRVDTGQHRLEQVGVVDWGSGGHNGQEYRPTVAGRDVMGRHETWLTRDCTSMTGIVVVAERVFGSRSPPGPALLVQVACQPVVDWTGKPAP